MSYINNSNNNNYNNFNNNNYYNNHNNNNTLSISPRPRRSRSNTSSVRSISPHNYYNNNNTLRISPRPRKSRSNTSSVRSISPPLVIINRDQNDALRKDVEEIVINFINAREKGYNFASVADCIIKTIDKQIHESNLIFYWLLNNQNTVQYMTLLGFFYFQGIGRSPNINGGGGGDDSQNASQSIYINGGGQDISQSIGQENKKKGFHLFLTAAKMGYSIAQDLVADCYCFGHGTPKNPDLSFEWYQKATHNGSIDGEFGLGYCYDMGIGVKRNLIKAIQHYKNSSKKENRSAMFLLAQCYDLGLGVEKDYEQAINLYKKAIEHGNTDACEPLEHLLLLLNYET
ncbi:hypothetical protein Glove_428g57 [Diversispora epigaea]|uniref:Uncharacterized protein n=1 Tax=Diversispora epigaea TaxID=1348612 RepID=A0A397GXB5_9GLOM|nr:hypothetical protein Glove_428g57 [Diversispora epigaea]